MSLIEQVASERRARLIRLGAIVPKPTPKPTPKPRPKPKKANPESIDAEPFYAQMWFYDLICPKEHKKPRPSVLQIKAVVCDYFGLLPVEVESSRRQGALVYPRQVAFFLARNLTNYSYPQIARRFGDRDHTTIMHGCRRIEQKVKTDWTVAYDVAHLEALL